VSAWHGWRLMLVPAVGFVAQALVPNSPSLKPCAPGPTAPPSRDAAGCLYAERGAASV
jgi:hypothetical protein